MKSKKISPNPFTIQKTRNRVDKKAKMIKPPHFHLIEKLELPSENPFWCPTTVKSGQSISIKAMVEYLNIASANDRKAVLLIRAYDDASNEVEIQLNQMFKSEAFGAYFIYLPSTQSEVTELYTFVVPEGVSMIHFGFSRFLCSDNEQVIVSDLMIYAQAEVQTSKKIGTASNHLIEKIELPSENPVWCPTTVKSGQSISIKAMVEYLNIASANDRKAVLLIRAYDDASNEVEIQLNQMFKSEAFGAYFIYLPSTQSEVTELYTFVVPEGVSTIHFGFSRFLCSDNEQIMISKVNIHAETEVELQRKFERTNTKSKEVHLDLGFYRNISKRFPLENFVNGKYRVLIAHKNQQVFNSRKHLILFFEEMSDEAKKNRKLPISDFNKQAFCYMGSGLKKGDTYYQDLYLDIDSSLRECKLYFYCTLPDFKLDKFVIEKLTQDKFELAKNNLKVQSSWSDVKLDKIKTETLEFLLYADINANVVDGSSVWLSSMASILASKGKTAIIVKENLRHTQVISNIENNYNIELVTPEKVGFDGVFDIEKGVELLKKIDDASPNLKLVVVRGCEVAYRLSETRQFYSRLASYITDFYTVDDNNLIMNEEKVEKLKLISLRSVYMLVQTQLIKNKIDEIVSNSPKYIEMPPPINDKFFEGTNNITDRLKINTNSGADDNVIKIGYAGKITPGWGIFELFSFIEKLKSDGFDVELYIAANKISSPTNLKEFRQKIQDWFKKLNVQYYDNFNREQSLEMLSKMDFIWCFRPAAFENTTLELSTKLVESVAIGGRCLCYPSAINVESLGKDYPFFIKNYHDFKDVLSKKELQLDSKFSENIWQKHSLKKIGENFHSHFLSEALSKNKVLFAGHDFKFIDAYISYLKSKGVPVKRETWEWGGHKNSKQLIDSYNWADTIFCEWGLANAVWYSNNNPDNKPIYVRMHAQEVRERAQKFGKQIDMDNIEKIIFVSQNICEQAIELFGYQESKTQFIPNFVMDDEFYFAKRNRSKNTVTLGLLGFVPQTKRLDRAVLLLDSLRKSGVNATLNVKGHRPEELEFMHAPSRVKELDYYYDTYEMINSLELAEYVNFEGWGANVQEWYEKVDIILSPSENESFHYAVADGVLSGCLPIVWSWKEASKIYPAGWVVENAEEAYVRVNQLILPNYKKNQISNLKTNRSYIVEKYGNDAVFTSLTKTILDE